MYCQLWIQIPLRGIKSGLSKTHTLHCSLLLCVTNGLVKHVVVVTMESSEVNDVTIRSEAIECQSEKPRLTFKVTAGE